MWHIGSYKTIYKKKKKKTRTQKHKVKAEISMTITRGNVRHFPLASGRIAFVYDMIGNIAGSNKY